MKKIKITEHGNYGYSLTESAERFGLDIERMLKDVEEKYGKMKVEPICVLCDMEYTSCKQKMPLDQFGRMWHCNGMSLSKKTIEEYRLI